MTTGISCDLPTLQSTSKQEVTFPLLFATGSHDHTIRLWDASNGTCTLVIPFGDSQVNTLTVSPDRRRLVASGYTNFKVYDLTLSNTSGQATPSNTLTSPIPPAGALIASAEAHTQNIIVALFLQPNPGTGLIVLATIAEDGWIKYWDASTWSLLYGLNLCTLLTTAATHRTIRETCAIVAGDSKGALYFVPFVPISSEQNRAEFQKFASGTDVAIRSVDFLDFAPSSTENADLCNKEYDEYVVSATHNGWVLIHHFCINRSGDGAPIYAVSHTLLHRFRAHQRYILKIRISPNNANLATASADGRCNLWKVPQKRGDDPIESQIQREEAHSSTEHPTQTHWLAQPWLLHRSFCGHQRWVWDVTFTCDSRYCITSSSDTTARLWDTSKDRSLLVYTGHQKPVTCLVLDEAP